LDRLEASRHAIFERSKILLLPPLVLPAFCGRRQQIKLGEDVAEAGRQHLLALERAAEREQCHVGAERKGSRVARQLAIEARRIADFRHRGEGAEAPASAPGAEQRGDAVADMLPERRVEGVETLVAIALAQRIYLVEQIGMRADRALPE